MKHYSIQPANLEFNAEGTPVSRDFDDVYFSNDNGLEETRYVFLGGNQLEARFPEHPHPLFVVAESGFGRHLISFAKRIRKRNYNAYISLVLRNFPSPVRI